MKRFFTTLILLTFLTACVPAKNTPPPGPKPTSTSSTVAQSEPVSAKIALSC